MVLPKFGKMKVNAVTAGLINRYLNELARKTPTQAKNARKVLSMVLRSCVLDGAIPTNPVNDLPRRSPKSKPVRALDAAGFQRMRELFDAWRSVGVGQNGAPRHPSFAAIDAFEVMAGTGLRIGEVLSLRPADLALDAEIPTLTVTGTLTEVAGAGGVQRVNRSRSRTTPFGRSLSPPSSSERYVDRWSSTAAQTSSSPPGPDAVSRRATSAEHGVRRVVARNSNG